MIASLCGDGVALALASGSEAARTHIAGGDAAQLSPYSRCSPEVADAVGVGNAPSMHDARPATLGGNCVSPMARGHAAVRQSDSFDSSPCRPFRRACSHLDQRDDLRLLLSPGRHLRWSGQRADLHRRELRCGHGCPDECPARPVWRARLGTCSASVRIGHPDLHRWCC